MGTGKSTVGPILAARVGARFIDTDDEIARATGRSVPDLWRDEGEAAFRARESKMVETLLAKGAPFAVVAFGGGTVTTRATRHLALDCATLVTLTAAPETMVARISDFASRPNLAVGGDPVARARALLEARAEAYAECHAMLATDALDPDSVADAVLAVAARDPLVVPLGARSYTIDVCRDAPALLTDAIARCAPSSVVVVSDANVQRARGAAFEQALAPLSFGGIRVTLPAGERHKTLASVSMIWDAALGAGIDREALVLAIGGGVVGDLAGFAASALLRGVRVLQAPTTLLAMVDASVGGKTGFDHPGGKNLLGAFHQPTGVIADLEHLTTLPARERTSGLAEIVKVALATDASLFEALERDSAAIRRGDLDALLPIVRAAIAAKAAVVRDDERESGRRAILNVGHTVGHALEAYGGYSRHLHGEAVAMGTVAELRATEQLGETPKAVVERATALFAALGLPALAPPGELSSSWSFVGADKKRMRGAVRLPVVTGIGSCRVDVVALDAFRRALLASTI